MNLFNLLPQEQELLENVIGINCEEGLERDGEKIPKLILIGILTRFRKNKKNYWHIHMQYYFQNLMKWKEP